MSLEIKLSYNAGEIRDPSVYRHNEQRAWALAGSLLRDTALLLTIATLNRTLHALGADNLVLSTLILRSTSRRLSYVHRISHGGLELCRI